MTKHRSFDPAYTLAELENALTQYQGLHGELVAIGHQAGDTIGSFAGSLGDDSAPDVVLRPGKPLPNPVGPVIDTDTVYITGQLQTVTAYRAS